MSYYKYLNNDKEYHDTYHKIYLNGHLRINLPAEVLEQYLIMAKSTKKPRRVTVKIITINKQLEPQIRRVEEVLKTVNLELNASEGSLLWKEPSSGPIQGKAFLAIIDNKVAGICTTEPIQDVPRSSRWMRFGTQAIVPNQYNSRAKVGISRIWVAPVWRRNGISLKLLDVTMKNSIYGVKLTKHNISFSQPSTNGGLLAKHFNGVVHKSGEYLLPVYLES
jgi:N-acetyltransferase